MKKFKNVLLTVLALSIIGVAINPLGGRKPPSVVDSINDSTQIDS